MSRAQPLYQSQSSSLATTTRLAGARIKAKVADAAAHALKALTLSLDQTPEGRPTAAKVKRSPSYQASIARLTELRDELHALAERSRVETYTAAWAFWRSELPAEVLAPSRGSAPPAALVTRARTMLTHGRTLRESLTAATDRAAKQLGPALTVAGNRATNSREANDAIRRWASASEGAIVAAFLAVVVDGQTTADRLAGRDVIRPELLLPDPSLPTAKQ
jgi:hypothetical protein